DATFAGSMLYEDRSTSTKTGFAPHSRTVDAVAKNVRGGMTTSWPGPMPWARSATWSAAVPFVTAIACFRPRSLAQALSTTATGGAHAVPAACDPAQDRRVRTDRGTVFDPRGEDFPVGTHRPRIEIVREARVRADENPISERDAPVQRREVLNLTIVPHDDRRIDVHVFANVAAPADPSALSDLCPMPNRGPVSDRGLPGDFGRRMHLDAHHLLGTPRGTHLTLLVQ